MPMDYNSVNVSSGSPFEWQGVITFPTYVRPV